MERSYAVSPVDLQENRATPRGKEYRTYQITKSLVEMYTVFQRPGSNNRQGAGKNPGKIQSDITGAVLSEEMELGHDSLL